MEKEDKEIQEEIIDESDEEKELGALQDILDEPTEFSIPNFRKRALEEISPVLSPSKTGTNPRDVREISIETRDKKEPQGGVYNTEDQIAGAGEQLGNYSSQDAYQSESGGDYDSTQVQSPDGSSNRLVGQRARSGFGSPRYPGTGTNSGMNESESGMGTMPNQSYDPSNPDERLKKEKRRM
jgi:hypothetical protein